MNARRTISTVLAAVTLTAGLTAPAHALDTPTATVTATTAKTPYRPMIVHLRRSQSRVHVTMRPGDPGYLSMAPGTHTDPRHQLDTVCATNPRVTVKVKRGAGVPWVTLKNGECRQIATRTKRGYVVAERN